MSNQLVHASFQTGSAALLQQLDPNWQAGGKSELAQGVRSGFGVISYKGKVWNIAFGGDKAPVMRDAGNGRKEPSSSLEVVLVQTSPHVAKTYYEGKWTEGDDSAPDCWSLDGVRPHPQVQRKQCESCALCPKNVWGSKVNDLGNLVKACSDSRRIAVVPLGDIPNETFGGPMLLRVPPASLQNAAKYGRELDKVGFPAHAVATVISFDTSEAYPSLVFEAMRPLTADEFKQVLALRDSEQVKQMLFDEDGGHAPPSQKQVAAPSVSALVGAVNPAAEEQAPEESEADRRIRELEAALAAKQPQAAVVEPPPPPVESEAERRIRELEEQLAAAKVPSGPTPEELAAQAAAAEEAKKAEAKRKREEAKAKKAAEEAAAKAAAEEAAKVAQAEDPATARIRALEAQLAAARGGATQPAPVQAQTVAQPAPVQAQTVAASTPATVATADTSAELDDLLAGIAGV